MRFETTMSQFGNNTGIEVPPEVLEALGGGKRPALHVVVNGFAYRSTVGVVGARSLVSFSADRRAETGIAGGDPITVDVELDTSPRTVEVPADLAAAMDAAGVRPAFDVLSPSARKAHVTSVEAAKTAATRTRRIDAIVAKVSA